MCILIYILQVHVVLMINKGYIQIAQTLIINTWILYVINKKMFFINKKLYCAKLLIVIFLVINYFDEYNILFKSIYIYTIFLLQQI